MAHLFPFIVVAIILIAKVIGNASKVSGGGLGPTPPRQAPTESDLERRRKFMEAMGLPSDSSPPPIVRPRTAANPPPLLPVKPPGVLIPPTPGRLIRVPSPAPYSPAPPPSPQPIVRRIPSIPADAPAIPAAIPAPQPAYVAPILPVPSAAASPAVSAAAATKAAQQISYPAKSLLLRLRDPASIREAIILREVLGPPKALQPRLFA